MTFYVADDHRLLHIPADFRNADNAVVDYLHEPTVDDRVNKHMILWSSWCYFFDFICENVLHEHVCLHSCKHTYLSVTITVAENAKPF